MAILSAVAALCLLQFQTCYGGRASNCLGMYTSQDPPGESQLDSAICKFINILAIFRSYETRNNWYGAGTTASNIYAAANACGQQYGIAFYIGHGDRVPNAWNQYHWYIESWGGGRVWDRWILFGGSPVNPPDPNPPTNRPVRFAYIWSCYQGGAPVGGVYHDPQWGTEYYGMPFAWLRTTNLDTDGYDFPDHTNSTFIGWLEEAPYLIDPFPWNGHDGQNASYYFLLNFYNSALYHQKTICQSLDDASAAVWGYSSYAMTGFRCGFWYTEPSTGETAWLLQVVYGDGSQRLR